MKVFSINTKITYSSEFNINLKRDALLAELCAKNKGSTYLTNLGSKVYLRESEYFLNKKIEVKYNSFEVFDYEQINGNFIGNLSTIDYLFNCGNLKFKK